jgi:hypothetical protein
MIDTDPARRTDQARPDVITASYAPLNRFHRAWVDHTPQFVFSDEGTDSNRSQRLAADEMARLRQMGPKPTRWPAILVVLLATATGLALFGVL